MFVREEPLRSALPVLLMVVSSLFGCTKPTNASTTDAAAAASATAPVATTASAPKPEPAVTPESWKAKISAVLGEKLVTTRFGKANVSAEARRLKRFEDMRWVLLNSEMNWASAFDAGVQSGDTFAQEAEILVELTYDDSFRSPIDALQSVVADTFAMKDVDRLVFAASTKKKADKDKTTELYSVYFIATVTRDVASSLTPDAGKLTPATLVKLLPSNGVTVIGQGQQIEWQLAQSKSN